MVLPSLASVSAIWSRYSVTLASPAVIPAARAIVAELAVTRPLPRWPAPIFEDGDRATFADTEAGWPPLPIESHRTVPTRGDSAARPTAAAPGADAARRWDATQGAPPPTRQSRPHGEALPRTEASTSPNTPVPDRARVLRSGSTDAGAPPAFERYERPRAGDAPATSAFDPRELQTLAREAVVRADRWGPARELARQTSTSPKDTVSPRPPRESADLRVPPAAPQPATPEDVSTSFDDARAQRRPGRAGISPVPAFEMPALRSSPETAPPEPGRLPSRPSDRDEGSPRQSERPGHPELATREEHTGAGTPPETSIIDPATEPVPFDAAPPAAGPNDARPVALDMAPAPSRAVDLAVGLPGPQPPSAAVAVGMPRGPELEVLAGAVFDRLEARLRRELLIAGERAGRA